MPPRFGHEADLGHHRKELLERGVTQIDHLRRHVVGDQLVEQFHLAAGVGDVHGPDQVGEMAGERRLARIEVEADKRPVVGAKVLNQQPGEQGLAHARMRRRDDIERRQLRHS